MKAMISVVLSSLILAGCQSGSTTAPSAVSKPSEATSATNTANPTQPNKGASTTKTADPTATKPPASDKPKQGHHRKLSQRLFQLDELQTVPLNISGHKFTAWVMDTEEKMQEGMMFLEDTDTKEDEAMLFVFPESKELDFWMHNTHIDLDIAYVTEKKVIRTIATMKAFDEKTTPSNGPCLYAIEFKSGVLKKNGIKTGMKTVFPDSVKNKG